MSNKVTKNIVTRDGYDKFIKELEYLKSTGRSETAEAIRVASEQGDLSENAEYDAAKEAQAHLERRIFELEEFLKNCEIVDVKDDDIVTIGKTILLKNKNQNKDLEIKLVGNNEAEPFSLNVSVASPVGRAIMDKKIGDIVSVEAPDGEIEYEILKVSI